MSPLLRAASDPSTSLGTGLITQTQLASTIAELLGFDWNAQSPDAGKPLPLKVRLSSRAP